MFRPSHSGSLNITPNRQVSLRSLTELIIESCPKLLKIKPACPKAKQRLWPALERLRTPIQASRAYIHDAECRQAIWANNRVAPLSGTHRLMTGVSPGRALGYGQCPACSPRVSLSTSLIRRTNRLWQGHASLRKLLWPHQLPLQPASSCYFSSRKSPSRS